MTISTPRRSPRRTSIFRLSAGAAVVLTALASFSAPVWAQDPPPSRCSDERTLPPAQLSAKDTALLDVGDADPRSQLQELVSLPAFPRPVPQVGWVGVVAILVWVAVAVAGWKSSSTARSIAARRWARPGC